ncbi:hypothetical protein [Micromonospora wenchangensis]|uniref:hypothetical protein n=1 Tax=Micromonospora wenchangensis TaxID=1185415 RepID=UPI003D766315
MSAPRTAGRRHRSVRRALVTVPMAALLITGCTDRPADPPPTPEPAPTDRRGTVARAEVGAELTVTAAVDRVVTDTAFVLRDVDFTDGRLLVLSSDPVTAQPPQLVTVRGTVIEFSHRELSARYDLGPAGSYRDFAGGRALAAREVTVWR